MSRPIITLTTDFGHGSAYVAQMKGVILSMNPEVNVVDVTHDIPPQDIRAGAQTLSDLFDWYPEGAIHVAVVDPGVGTSRNIVYVNAGGRHFIAPDNGLLSRVIRQHEPQQQVFLTNSEYWLGDVSSTFHGRDIMAPAAAHLSLGLDPEKLGEGAEKLNRLSWPEIHLENCSIQGTIISFDSFGNLITDITAQTLFEASAKNPMSIHCGHHEIQNLVKTYGTQPPGSLVALIGSSHFLELAVVNGNAAHVLGVDVGEKITVTW